MTQGGNEIEIASYDAKAPLKFVDSPEFHQPGAESLIIVPVPQLAYENIAAGDDWYLKMMSVAPLPRAQQGDLFRMMNYLKFRASVAHGPQEMQRLKDWAIEVRSVLALTNRRLIHCSIGRVLNRLRQSNRDKFDDVVSEACKSLLKAVDLYDYMMGFAFSTFACQRIKFENRNNWRRQSRIESQTTQFAEDANGRGAIEYVESKEIDPVIEAGRREAARKVRQLLKRLNPAQRRIVEAYYGLGGQPQTQEQIAATLQLSKSRVGQIRDAALKRMLAAIAGAA